MSSFSKCRITDVGNTEKCVLAWKRSNGRLPAVRTDYDTG